MPLHNYIRDLLFLYDCVIIPDFGGFICSYKPAGIHPVKHKFTPPAKKVSFNRMLVMNDGLLAHHIAIENGITYNEALSGISAEISVWKRDLKQGKAVFLESIGQFVNDDSGNLQFFQATEFNYLISSYGLTSFHFLPIDRKEKLKLVHSAVNERSSQESRLSISRMAKYSVAAALISIAALTTYKLQVFDDLPIDKVSLSLFKTDKTVYKSVNHPSFEPEFEGSETGISKKLTEELDAGFSYKINIEGIDKSLTVIDKTKVEVKRSMDTSIGKFHIVGGCFGVEENADKLVKKLKKQGFSANKSVSHKGLRVVSYESFNNEEEARAFLIKIREEHNNQAWLLIK